MNDPLTATDHRSSLLPAVVTGLTVTAVMVILVTSALFAGAVPDAVVSRWGAGGAPADTTPLWALTLVMATTSASVGVLLGVIARRVGPPGAQRVLTGLAMGLPVAIAVLHVGTVVAAADQGADARFPGVAGVVAVALVVGLGALGYGLADPVEQVARSLEPTVLDVADGEAVLWTGRDVAPSWQWTLLGVATAVGVPLLWAASPWLGLVLLAAMALGGSALVVRVTVGPGGLSVRTGPAGLVRMHVPIDRITAADAIVVDPLAHGGYGVRLMPGLRGVVYRAGPGLRVEQRDGPTTVVTVSGATEAAGVLRAHLDGSRADAG